MSGATGGPLQLGGHLVRRCLGSLSRRPPAAADLHWVTSTLGVAELALWQRLGPADRRHAVQVARATVARLPVEAGAPEPPGALVAAALLHDIGKLDAGFGVPGRVAATVWRLLRGPAAARGTGRVARYLCHEAIGAEWCRQLGSDPQTVALVARSPDARSDWLAALAAADDAI